MKAINIHVFSLLKDNVQTMSDKDRVYFLMFDDMSIREHLYFNQKFYCIEGFEDFETHGKASTISNLALVFMLRGLYKMWKQPGAYYLNRRSTKVEIFFLLNFLMEFLDTCPSAGLEVVSTLCDMGVNSVKALKQFGVSKKTHFFRFLDQEISARFEPPHLLK